MFFFTIDQVTTNERQKEQDLTKENDPAKTSKKKFSPKDLLPRGAGSQSIQEILANFTQVYSPFFHAFHDSFQRLFASRENSRKAERKYNCQT